MMITKNYTNVDIKKTSGVGILSPTINADCRSPVIVFPAWDGTWSMLFNVFSQNIDLIVPFYSHQGFVTKGVGVVDVPVFRLPDGWTRIVSHYKYRKNKHESVLFLIRLLLSGYVPFSIIEYLTGEFFPFLEEIIHEHGVHKDGLVFLRHNKMYDAGTVIIDLFESWKVDIDVTKLTVVQSVFAPREKVIVQWQDYFVSRPKKPYYDVEAIKKIIAYLFKEPLSSSLQVGVVVDMPAKRAATLMHKSHCISRTSSPYLYYIPGGHVFYPEDELTYLSTEECPVRDMPFCMACLTSSPRGQMEIVATMLDDRTFMARVQWGSAVCYGASPTKRDAINTAITYMVHPYCCSVAYPHVQPEVVRKVIEYYKVDENDLKKQCVRLKVLSRIAMEIDPERIEDHHLSISSKRFTSRSGVYFYKVRENRYRSYFSSPSFMYEVSLVIDSVFYKDFTTYASSSGELCSTVPLVQATIASGECFFFDGVDISMGPGLCIPSLEDIFSFPMEVVATEIMDILDLGPISFEKFVMIAGNRASTSQLLAMMLNKRMISFTNDVIAMYAVNVSEMDRRFCYSAYDRICGVLKVLPGKNLSIKLMNLRKFSLSHQERRFLEIMDTWRKNRNLLVHELDLHVLANAYVFVPHDEDLIDAMICSFEAFFARMFEGFFSGKLNNGYIVVEGKSYALSLGSVLELRSQVGMFLSLYFTRPFSSFKVIQNDRGVYTYTLLS